MQWEKYRYPICHNHAIALNTARNCLLYLIITLNIRKIWLPKLLCNSVIDICRKMEIEIQFYNIGQDFLPMGINLEQNDWLYLVNYYGQLKNDTIVQMKQTHEKIIVDNVQAFFQKPLQGIHTIYSCRKYFGVSDGAFLYTDKILQQDLPQDESHTRMQHCLGRVEREASEFYESYCESEEKFKDVPLRKMSKLTMNLLHGIDFELVKTIRERNFLFLHNELKEINKLNVIIPEGAFMYPLYLDEKVNIRQELINQKIYIPVFWKEAFLRCKGALEYDMAMNILPLPVDQRYGLEEMKDLVDSIKESINRTQSQER